MGIQPDDTSPEKNCPSEGAGAKQENTYADEIISLNEASGHAASGADQAIEFLQWLRPDGPWLILAWKDANKPFGKTCTDSLSVSLHPFEGSHVFRRVLFRHHHGPYNCQEENDCANFE